MRPGVSHGVLITMHVEEENELTEAKRWDATRAHAPAVSVNRMQKMVKEDTRNAVRTEKLFAKAGTPSWELGARPNIPMTFIEYPITPSPDVTTRGRFDFASVSEGEGKRRGGGKGRGRQQLQSLAWASPPTAKYAPLGNMDNLTGDQVHPSRFTNALVRLGGIKVVEPMAGTEDDSLEEHKRLVHGDCCEDVVRKGEYVYYSIEVPPPLHTLSSSPPYPFLSFCSQAFSLSPPSQLVMTLAELGTTPTYHQALIFLLTDAAHSSRGS